MIQAGVDLRLTRLNAEHSRRIHKAGHAILAAAEGNHFQRRTLPPEDVPDIPYFAAAVPHSQQAAAA